MHTARSHPAAPPAAVPSTVAIDAVRGLARAARVLERASGDLGLAQYRVLASIAGGEERAARVAERLELGRPTISAAVDGLCRAGLVVRKEASHDQRAINLYLTSRGWRTLQDVEAQMVQALGDVLRHAPVGPPADETVAATPEVGGAGATLRNPSPRPEPDVDAVLRGLAALGPAIDTARGLPRARARRGASGRPST